MSLLSALLKSYDYALDNNMVGKPDQYGDIILPMYYGSKKSDGKNIIEVLIDKDSELKDANLLDDGEVIIFPVTEDSVARSSGLAPHPLTDSASYVIPDGGKRSAAYLEQMEMWLNYDDNDYVRIIYKFLQRENIYTAIQNYVKEHQEEEIEKQQEVKKGKKKKPEKIDYEKVFITFSIVDYDGLRNVSVSDNLDLQKCYRSFVEFQNERDPNRPKIICNLSGKSDFLCVKHQPLIVNARLLPQITAKAENYKGRFSKADQNIVLSVETSQKIHLMAKYLLSGKNTHSWLGENAQVIAWFSDDIRNESEASIERSIQPDIVEEIMQRAVADTKDESGLSIADETTKEIVRSFTNGNPKFSNDAKYYVAILDSISKGRVMMKYFKELSVSRLKANLYSWHEKYHWYGSGKETRNKKYTPSLKRIILAAYGTERENDNLQKKAGLKVSKEAFYISQYQNIITALIEGRDIPANFTKALAINIRNRMHYDETWNEVKFCALAVLNHRGGFESAMIKRDYTNRSYLFGRLLALFEQMEIISYEEDKVRTTHAQKLWASYTNNPAVNMLRIRKLLTPYEIKLAKSESPIKRELYRGITEEITTVTTMLNENYDIRSREMNRPLDYMFIFGYEAQRRSVQSKKYRVEKQVEEKEAQNDQQ